MTAVTALAAWLDAIEARTKETSGTYVIAGPDARWIGLQLADVPRLVAALRVAVEALNHWSTGPQFEVARDALRRVDAIAGGEM